MPCHVALRNSPMLGVMRALKAGVGWSICSWVSGERGSLRGLWKELGERFSSLVYCAW